MGAPSFSTAQQLPSFKLLAPFHHHPFGNSFSSSLKGIYLGRRAFGDRTLIHSVSRSLNMTRWRVKVLHPPARWTAMSTTVTQARRRRKSKKGVWLLLSSMSGGCFKSPVDGGKCMRQL